MYYPIIDKLKEVMADITSVKEKEPLTIIGTLTDINRGIWTGDWNDISNAFSTNKPVYFKILENNTTLFVPVIVLTNTSASSGLLYFHNTTVVGIISNNGTFVVNPI